MTAGKRFAVGDRSNIVLIGLFTVCVFNLSLGVAAQVLQVGASGRHLRYEDGKPFLYLGDTAWELFHRLDREDADHYLKSRAEGGFTVIQAVILAELDGLRTPNAYGALPLEVLDPTRPNEDYFQHVDYVVDKAKELGLFMALLPTWGDKVHSANPGAGPVIFNPDNAYRYGLFLGKRYRDKPVVWILGGDRNVAGDEVLEIWRSMARGLKEGSGRKQLISYHPRGSAQSSWWFHNEDWLDFNMYQSGHETKMSPVYHYARRHRMIRPVKPFVDGEPGYEDIPVRFWELIDWSRPPMQRVPEGVLSSEGSLVRKEYFQYGFISDHDVRVTAYWNLLAGAAGYTYGNNAVWQMWEPGRAFSIPCLTDWKQALERPGSKDIRHIRDLFESRDFSQLVPDQSLVYGENRDGPDHIRSALARDGSYAVIYLARGQAVRIYLPKLNAERVKAWWYDPRTGETRLEGLHSSDRIATFRPPRGSGENDWVLVLERDTVFTNPPGEW